jgi:hypothetical protein
MKTKICTLLFCMSAIMFGCKKEAAKETHKARVKTNARMLGARLQDQAAYRKLIREDRLKGAKIAAACSAVDIAYLFPAPGDQGVQGSCVSWAVAYGAKSFYERGEIGWPLTSNNHVFSPQYVYSQTHYDNSEGGGGSYFSDALNLVVNQGVSTLDVTPYDPWDAYGYQSTPNLDQRRQAFYFRNTTWSALPTRNVEEIRVHLCNRQPVLLGFPVYPDFDNLGPGNEVYDNLDGAYRGGHGVVIVGYDDARQAFRILNQWTQWWGLDGYGWISYDLIANNDWEAYVMYDSENPLLGETYNATTAAGMSTIGYVSGDFNGDGNTDIIHPWDYNGNLAILVHNMYASSGTNIICNQTSTGAGSGNVGMVAGDFNGDGKCDLIQGWDNGGQLALTVFASNGSNFNVAWNSNMGQGSGNLRLLPVDMDGDGKTDIAQIWNNNGKVGIFIYRSTGSSYYQATYLPTDVGVGNVGFFPADWNGDGKTDIIQCWNNGGALGIIVYGSNGSGYSVVHTGTAPQGYGNVGLVPLDYDGDGKTDFVQCWNKNGRLNLILYRSTGSSFEYIGNYATMESPTNYGMLPVKRAGLKDGFAQIWKNGSSTAIFRYDVLNYQ